MPLKIFLLTFCFSAWAVHIEWSATPVSIEHSWEGFLNNFLHDMDDPDHFLNPEPALSKDPHNGVVRIAPLREVPNTLVVGFNYSDTMNWAFLRASIFVEKLSGLYGGYTTIEIDGGPIVSNDALEQAIAHVIIGGHDLRAKDLLVYWTALDKMIAQDEQFVISPSELQVRAMLEPHFKAHPETALVVFAINPYRSEVVTHEISHAQYFNSPHYKKAVLAYWNSMSIADKDAARDALSNSIGRYDRASEDLMINEFQAYLTNLNVHRNPILASLHDPHFALLRAHLIHSLDGARLIEIPMVRPERRLSLCSKYIIAPLS